VRHCQPVLPPLSFRRRSCGLQLAEGRFERESTRSSAESRFMNPFAHPRRISSVQTRATFRRLQRPLHPGSGAVS
jgi:hypothetical protein